MSDRTDDLRGALFKNPNKRPEKKDPDYTGSCVIGGNNFYMDAWINESRNDGTKYLGLKFKLKAGQIQKMQQAKISETPDFDDDIPF